MLTSSINSSGTQNNNGGRLGRNRKRRRRLPLFLLILASILVSIFFYISSFPGSNYARRVTKRIFFPLKIQLRSSKKHIYCSIQKVKHYMYMLRLVRNYALWFDCNPTSFKGGNHGQIESKW